MTEKLYTWHYLCDTCKYADSDGVGHFICLDYAPPEYDGECSGPISAKLPIPRPIPTKPKVLVLAETTGITGMARAGSAGA